MNRLTKSSSITARSKLCCRAAIDPRDRTTSNPVTSASRSSCLGPRESRHVKCRRMQGRGAGFSPSRTCPPDELPVVEERVRDCGRRRRGPERRVLRPSRPRFAAPTRPAAVRRRSPPSRRSVVGGRRLPVFLIDRTWSLSLARGRRDSAPAARRRPPERALSRLSAGGLCTHFFRPAPVALPVRPRHQEFLSASVKRSSFRPVLQTCRCRRRSPEGPTSSSPR